MAKPLPLSQSYADKMVKAFVKAGLTPRITFDFNAGTATIEHAENDDKPASSGWQERAPDRV